MQIEKSHKNTLGISPGLRTTTVAGLGLLVLLSAVLDHFGFGEPSKGLLWLAAALALVEGLYLRLR